MITYIYVGGSVFAVMTCNIRNEASAITSSDSQRVIFVNIYIYTHGRWSVSSQDSLHNSQRTIDVTCFVGGRFILKTAFCSISFERVPSSLLSNGMSAPGKVAMWGFHFKKGSISPERRSSSELALMSTPVRNLKSLRTELQRN